MFKKISTSTMKMNKKSDKQLRILFPKSSKTIPRSQIQKLVKVKELYDELGTLQKVAYKMKITRERVRQLLNKGEEYNIYDYEPHREEIFRKLVKQFSRETLIKEIKMLISPTKVSIKLNLSQSQLSKLLKYHNIDYADYRKAAKMGKCLEQYSRVVDFLGRHPSTTEMCNNHDWLLLYRKIFGHWGSIDNFRSEYGIEKPVMRIHPNTLKGFRDHKLKGMRRKAIKVKRLVDFMSKEESPVSASILRANLTYGPATIWNYLNELIRKDRVERIGDGMDVKYRLKD